MTEYKGYEAVIGIEIHAELATSSKIFCSCPTSYGALPNANTCPVCMGFPGTLPTLNRRALELACIAGKVTNCRINTESRTDRKNYFYPDLPKAYQISQYDRPLCEDGWLCTEHEGKSVRIGIERIHIEEDAGKLIHDKDKSYIDHNRCGVPLIEIVTKPDMRCAEEAVAFLTALRLRLLFAGVSLCRMNEGNIRFDVNLSVRAVGDGALYTRTEIKNLNSFQNVARAIELEFIRQVDIVCEGGKVEQGTLRYDEDRDCILFMREKENAHGYRFFEEPDIPPIILTSEEIEEICKNIPRMPDERVREYTEKYALTAEDAAILTSSPEISDYFECATKSSASPKYTANLIIGELLRQTEPDKLFDVLLPEHLSEISDMASNGEINSSTAKKLVKLLLNTHISPKKYAREHAMLQVRDEAVIRGYVIEALEGDARSVEDYKRGKQNAKKAIFGAVMRKSGGNADPMIVERVLSVELDKLLQK